MTATVVRVGTPVRSTGSVRPAWPTPHHVGQLGLLLVVNPDVAIVFTDAADFAQFPNSPQGVTFGSGGSVTHRATVLHNETDPTTGFTFTVGGTVAVGDDLYVQVSSRDHNSGIDYPTVTDNDTTGNPWERLSSTPARKGHLFWKKATAGTAGKTVTVAGTVGSGSGLLSAYIGGAAGNPTTDIVTQTNGGGVESHAGFTPSFANEMVCLTVFQHANDNSIASPACTNPGALTIRGQALSAGGNDSGVAHASAAQTGGPTATGTFTWTQPDNVTTSMTWGIKPGLSKKIRLGAFWCRAVGPQMRAPTIAANGDHNHAAILLVDGAVASGNPYDATPQGDTQGTQDTTVEMPGLTTTVVNDLIIHLLGRELASVQATAWVNAALGSLAEIFESNATQGSGSGMSVARGFKATIGATGSTAANLDAASIQARMTIAIKPFVPLVTSVFLTVYDPLNLALTKVLSVVEGTWRELEPEYRGEKSRAFDGTLISTQNSPKRRFQCSVDFNTPADVDAFRLFIDSLPDPVNNTFEGPRPMYIGGGEARSALRGAAQMLVLISIGEMTATDFTDTGGFITQSWRVDLLMEEI